MTGFTGKVILITGSSRGIGRATARRLAPLGARIVLNGRNQTKLNQTKEEIQQLGADCLAISADVTDYVQCEKMVEQVLSQWGRIDALITNAGLVMESSFEQADIKATKLIIDSHIYGSVFPIKAALPELLKNRGSIVLVSSLAGLYGMPKFSAYCSGKMALTALAQSLRQEYKKAELHIGLLFVAFVENDNDKTLVSSEGKPMDMLPRPSRLQQSQKQVAASIVKMIARRRKLMVLSVYGKIYAFLARFSKPLLNYCLKIYTKT